MEVSPEAVESILSSAIEVGIGVLGFSGIVIALASQKSSSVGILLSTLVVASIALVSFSFLPQFFGLFELESTISWRLGSATMAIYVLIMSGYRMVRGHWHTDPTSINDQVTRVSYLIVVLANWLFVILQIANVVVIGQAWPYLLHIGYYVLFSMWTFATLLWVVWADKDDT